LASARAGTGEGDSVVRQHSIPALVEIPSSANLAGIVSQRAADNPQQVALRRPDGTGGWRDITISEFRDDVAGLAKGLIAAGIGTGDRVALMSRTRYEWTALDFAIWTAGAVCVPVYETSSAEQVEWIVSNSGAKAIFVESAAHEEIVTGLRDRLTTVEHVWRIEEPAGGPAEAEGKAPGLEALRAEGTAVTDETVAERATAAGADDLATVIYTSGTTGRPKGCELTHRNLLAEVRNASASAPEIFGARGRSTLLFLPLAHVLARVIEVGCLDSGIVLGHSPDVANLLPDLGSFRPTFLLAVPRVFEKVYNGAEQKADADGRASIFQRSAQTAIAYSQALDDRARGGRGPGFGLRATHTVFDKLVYSKLRGAVGGQVQYAVSGGSALGERLGHFFRGVGITILEGYGLTETTAAATVNRPSSNKVGTVGQVVPGNAIKIGDDGEILVKGPTVFARYWRNDEATAATVTEDGWFQTGDLGELDDEGFLKITGRKKEIIVTAAGKNVAPAPLEDRIRAHPLVSQAMVIGDGRRYVTALITIDEEAFPAWKEKHSKPASATVADLRDNGDLIADIQAAVDDANASVSRAESIRKFRIVDGDFTQENGQLTPSLKVRRNVVAEDRAADIEALYAS
jgi:long-chain acyl-CoA synthetase